MTSPQAFPGAPFPPAAARTSGRAIAAPLTGIVSLVFCGPSTGIPAVVLAILGSLVLIAAFAVGIHRGSVETHCQVTGLSGSTPSC